MSTRSSQGLQALLRWAAPALVALSLAACGGAGGGNYSPGAAGPPPPPPPTPPAITTGPTAQTVVEGAAASFAVTATGSAPLTYQWRRDGTTIAGAIAANYTLPTTVLADSGALFSVVVSNAAGSVTSGNALLTVNPAATAPAIVQQPQSVTVAVGAGATFTVAATGTAPLAYQWRRDGTAVAGATGTNYTLANAQLADNGASFDVVVSNAAGSTTSNAATLTVTASPPPPTASGVCFVSGPTTTCWAEPKPQGNDIADAQFIGSGNATGFAVAGNSLLRSDDGGASWSVAFTSSVGPLAGVSFGSVSVGVAAGFDEGANAARIFRSADGGTTWTPATVPANLPPLRGVRFVSPTLAFAVGENRILRSTDAGVSWAVVSTLTETWNGVAFDPGLTTGVAVGFRGVAQGITARTLDGGATWSQSASVGGVDVDLASAFVSVSINGQIRRSTDSGVTWTTVPTGTTQFLRAVSFVDANLGLAVGNAGTILRTSDGGQSWSGVPSGTTEPLNSVRWRDANNVVVQGNAGTLRRSSDGGLTWSGPLKLTTNDLYGLAHNGGGVVVAAGFAGTVLRSADSGANWAATASGVGAQLNATAFASSSVAVVVGDAGTIRRSSDAGLNWAGVTGGGGSDHLLDVHFGSASVGVAVGESGRVLRTTDGGATWVPAATVPTTTDLVSVRFASPSVVVAVSSSAGIVRSTDGGANWTLVTSGGAELVRFASANVGLAATQGSYRRTTDGGATWSAPIAFATPGAELLRFDFYSATAGFGVLNGAGPTGAQYVSTLDGGASLTVLAAAPADVAFPWIDGIGGWVVLSPTQAIAAGESGTLFSVLRP